MNILQSSRERLGCKRTADFIYGGSDAIITIVRQTNYPIIPRWWLRWSGNLFVIVFCRLGSYGSCSRRMNESCAFWPCYGRRINPENLVFQVIFEESATVLGVSHETFPCEQFRGVSAETKFTMHEFYCLGGWCIGQKVPFSNLD